MKSNVPSFLHKITLFEIKLIKIQYKHSIRILFSVTLGAIFEILKFQNDYYSTMHIFSS